MGGSGRPALAAACLWARPARTPSAFWPPGAVTPEVRARGAASKGVRLGPADLHVQVVCNNVVAMQCAEPNTRTLEDIREALRTSGLRVTASRIGVLRLLAAANRPLSHQDVVDALAEHPWNRSTLYRNLLDLVDTGLAFRAVFGGVARFELAGRANSCMEHPHFVCTACGEVNHLEGVRLRIEGDALPRAVLEGHYEVQLRGRCDDCA